MAQPSGRNRAQIVGGQPRGRMLSQLYQPLVTAVAAATWLATASPKSEVAALPPMSGVRTSDVASTAAIALSIASAASPSPRWRSIIAPDQIWATGLATCLPAMSGADPCTGSNMEGYSRSGLRFPEGARPIDPTTPAPRSDKMSPNRLEATTTSNQSG